MRRDIETTEDITTLVNSFYERVREDEVIGYIFTEIARVNWEEHLSKMYGFWETVLFGKMSYKGNPMLRHLELSKKTEMNGKHFDRWISLWTQSVDCYFEGEKAEEAKMRGRSIAGIMLYKINYFTEQKTR